MFRIFKRGIARVAKFERVSFDQFISGTGYVDDMYSLHTYEKIKLPQRATKGSSGYDFFCPTKIDLNPGESVVVPTGIRVKIDDGWWLMCIPKSGLGSKFKMRLNNTVGDIDSDYYYSENEGHIIAAISNEGTKPLHIDAGQKFFQGVFVPYGITYDDNANGKRNGGFGSTGK